MPCLNYGLLPELGFKAYLFSISIVLSIPRYVQNARSVEDVGGVNTCSQNTPSKHRKH